MQKTPKKIAACAMKTWASAAFFLYTACASLTGAHAQTQPADTGGLLQSWADSADGTPPSPWRVVGLPGGKVPLLAPDITTLDGQKVLRLRSDKSYGALSHAVPAGSEGRYLQWQWRLDQPLAQADLLVDRPTIDTAIAGIADKPALAKALGASLRADDVVQNFIVSTTHHWLMFFTNTGRVFRSKVYEIQESGRDAKGQHVANLLALQPEERIVEVLDLKDYQQAPYLVLATRAGLVKKTALEAYDTARTGGIIAIKLREGDELVNAMLVSDENDLLLVSRKGMSIRFSASSEQLRPMGRDTSGVMGMSFRKGDELLSATVIGEAGFVFVVTEGGYAKRTSADQYRIQNRGGLGIKVAKLDEKRGDLVGALIVDEADEVLVVLASGKVIRTNAAEVPAKGRDTMGVVFARFEESDSVLSLARNTERNLETNDLVDAEGEPDGEAVQAE